MEKINRTICFEDSVSRIPSDYPHLEEGKIVTGGNGSWGNIPCDMELEWMETKHDGSGNTYEEKTVRRFSYNEMMNMYREAERIVEGAEYVVFSDNMKKWSHCSVQGKEALYEPYFYGLSMETPATGIHDKGIVGITSDYMTLKRFSDITGCGRPDEFIREIEKKIGRIHVPSDVRGTLTPVYIYSREIDLYRKIGTDLLSTADRDCCMRAKYSDYGGDGFFVRFLDKAEAAARGYMSSMNSFGRKAKVTYRVPEMKVYLCLTSIYDDMGVYFPTEYETDADTPAKGISVTEGGESVLRSLRRRKRSYDGDRELPGIIPEEGNRLIDPYPALHYYDGDRIPEKCENYVKNVSYSDGTYYGDQIYMKVISEDRKSIKFIYVTGATYTMTDSGLMLAETPEYPMTGIWREETYPFKENVPIGGYVYDKVDFEAKMTDVDFEGIDFNRYKTVLSDKTWHSSEQRIPSFSVYRDERYLGISEPVKEIYSVDVDRGRTEAFERLLKLSEVKTFDDMRKYGNNYFNIR